MVRGEPQSLLLLVTDSCDPGPALARALGLVRDTGARLTLLDAAEPLPHYVQTFLDEAALGRLQADEDRQRRERLDRLVAEAAGQGVTVRTRRATGPLFQVAVREYLAGGHDLLVKTLDRPEPGARVIQSPLDRQLLRTCPGPLWLERPGSPARLGRILVAVNPDPAAPEDQALAVELLRDALALADRHPAGRSAKMPAEMPAENPTELHVLHAWKVLRQWIADPSEPVDPALAPVLDQVRQRHAGCLAEALEAAGVPRGRVQSHLVHQRASRAIIEAVATIGPDLLVMGTLGRTGIPGLFIGNTAERVLGEVGCSILARKPAGFVAPVAVTPS